MVYSLYLLHNYLIENLDYLGEVDSSVEFSPGDFAGVSRCTNISIFEDTVVEYDEVMNVLLTTNSSRLAIQSDRNSTQITITEDDDCKLKKVVYFRQFKYYLWKRRGILLI